MGHYSFIHRVIIEKAHERKINLLFKFENFTLFHFKGENGQRLRD